MLIKENTGLIVVDIQGKLARIVHDSETLIANSAKLIKGAQVLGLPILWLEQNSEKLGPTVEELGILLDEQQPIEKFTFNGCAEPNFMEAVRRSDVQTWLVCGIETHICVYQTAMGLKHHGYGVQLVQDCISSRTAENKQLGITKLINNGIELTGLEMCLYELVKDCRETEFRDVLSLIK
ncbi:hydrolase [Vibrio japonicus]|uniref:Hydrolase n=1 Tax=Vibrio japonicus TaxID=1824638 RepID=A0ABY5LLF9_9VIBR|nr:hydrolase [Vibrio japonicus]UUM31975.1 hydrolase [Vibrio japonicus]